MKKIVHNKNMMKKNKEYIILLFLFLLGIFIFNINTFSLNDYQEKTLNSLSNIYCENIKKDYEELLEANQFLITNNLNAILTKVKFRNIYNYKNSLTIYKGSGDNIVKGMLVLDENGLVGIIDKVYKNNSEVKLITNKDINISVKINNSYGILKLSGGKIIVTDLTLYDEINVDDEVYTSGIGNLLGNIFIGKVKNIDIDKNNIEKTLEISLGSNLNNLNYLYVVG